MSRISVNEMDNSPLSAAGLLSALKAALDAEIARAKRVAEECDRILESVGVSVYGRRAEDR